MLNLDNEKHRAADARLRADLVIWLTTVSGSGQPQSTPVWFRWDGKEFLIFGSRNGAKTPNIRSNPHVSLHLDGDGSGGGNVIFEGTATVDADGAQADEASDYLAKYGPVIESYGWTAEGMTRDYPHVIRIAPTRVRIF
jgi:PPOX class probable F420-dependent enzyme